ncbi:hypothetical protein PTE30175_04825 [Pandoraea terrae]|uniref:Uncharacterized protein n=1 Tax=Pandoraea terrae TaxID=1537710 RepID=A0A5E4YZL3_9BURK|nr:hypothetical protein PTE30175_04825 [Pandoraea terrae]
MRWPRPYASVCTTMSDWLRNRSCSMSRYAFIGGLRRRLNPCSPRPLHVTDRSKIILTDQVVMRQQDDPFGNGLANQNPVEWVFVQRG